MNRYKPVGWRGESYRHYLAKKGISTKRYLANDLMLRQQTYPMLLGAGTGKGNTKDTPNIQRYHALHWTDEQMLANSAVLLEGIDPVTGEMLPPFTDGDLKVLENKMRDKRKLSERFPPPMRMGATESPLPFGFGTAPPVVKFEEPPVPANVALDFGPSIDVPKELPPSQEAAEIEAEVEAQQMQRALAPSGPKALEAEKSKVMTPPVGLPENILI